MAAFPPDIIRRPPAEVPAEALQRPEVFDLRFEGFTEEAFAILRRMRANPHIAQYHAEKEGVRQHLTEPFKRYRDDVVVNFVLPNRLDFETERNVFSRLLKNDFGAGGAHHHLWMAFYRPGRRRLTDLQLSHSIHPDHFSVGLFVGAQMRAVRRAVRARLDASPEAFLAALNPLLQNKKLRYRGGAGKGRRVEVLDAPLDALPEAFLAAEDFWVETRFPAADVVRWGADLVPRAVDALHTLWPLYRFLAAATP